MKKHTVWIYVVAALCCTAIFTACRKTPKPGKGGNAVLKITPKHHSAFIDSCTVYIKYASSNLPADGKYDDSAKCVPENGKPVATFANMNKGDYYLFGSGWDPTIPDTVIGGAPYTIKEETTLYYNLAVTEGD